MSALLHIACANGARSGASHSVKSSSDLDSPFSTALNFGLIAAEMTVNGCGNCIGNITIRGSSAVLVDRLFLWRRKAAYVGADRQLLGRKRIVDRLRTLPRFRCIG